MREYVKGNFCTVNEGKIHDLCQPSLLGKIGLLGVSDFVDDFLKGVKPIAVDDSFVQMFLHARGKSDIAKTASICLDLCDWQNYWKKG